MNGMPHPPKARLLGLACFALLLGVAHSQAPQPAPAAAELPGLKIQFDSEEWAWEKLEQGAMAEHTFVVTNAGTQPLIITEAKSSCGCTVPNFSKDPIPPGGKGEVNVSFNSRGRQGMQHKSVTVKSNDPNRPIVNLNISGDVATPDAGDIQINPMRLDFGLVNSADFIEQEVIVRNVGKRDLLIQGVTGAPTELNAFIEGPTTVPVGGTTKIIVTLQPGSRTQGGYYERSVTVRSDDPMKPTMRLPAVAYIRADRGPRLLTVAGEIDVGAVEEPGKQLLRIPLLNPGDAPLVIDNIQVAGTSVAIDSLNGTSIGPGESAFLVVRSGATLHKGTFRDRLLIYANDARLNPQAPSQSLTVFGYVTVDSWNQAGTNANAPAPAAVKGDAPPAVAPGTNTGGEQK